MSHNPVVQYKVDVPGAHYTLPSRPIQPRPSRLLHSRRENHSRINITDFLQSIKQQCQPEHELRSLVSRSNHRPGQSPGEYTSTTLNLFSFFFLLLFFFFFSLSITILYLSVFPPVLLSPALALSHQSLSRPVQQSNLLAPILSLQLAHLLPLYQSLSVQPSPQYFGLYILFFLLLDAVYTNGDFAGRPQTDPITARVPELWYFHHASLAQR